MAVSAFITLLIVRIKPFNYIIKIVTIWAILAKFDKQLNSHIYKLLKLGTLKKKYGKESIIR